MQDSDTDRASYVEAGDGSDSDFFIREEIVESDFSVDGERASDLCQEALLLKTRQKKPRLPKLRSPDLE
ncbi:hypothetical protein NDU88_007186 [Pleurodeles waltl]|uniref:Uncharacterized protein n=1 Tax=Pleurodeles waltl TaxID=8319 RepID=A0AAV7PN15_PLEWA|nr:hypothetical protein NDU88_007186 [Pleurodeles waltl]